MKYLKSFNESIDDEVCKYLNDDEYQYWREKIVGIPHYKAINIIKKQIEIIESDFSKEYEESKFVIGRDRVTYNGNPLYGARAGLGIPSTPRELMMAVSYCGDDWYLVELFHNWHFYTFLCDDLIGLESLGQKVIEKIERGGRVNETYHNDEINRDEYRELLGGTFDSELKKVLPFDDSEFEEIKHVCFKLTKNSSIMTPDKKAISVFYRNTPRILIEKFDDEWYVCKYIQENKYFKCDTFEGLIKELKRYLY